MTQEELILNCTPVFAALKLSVGGKSDYYKSLFDAEVRLENKYKVSDIYFLLENCPEWPAEENPC